MGLFYFRPTLLNKGLSVDFSSILFCSKFKTAILNWRWYELGAFGNFGHFDVCFDRLIMLVMLDT